MSHSDLERPLALAAFHILLALEDGDIHGYAIMRVVTQQSDGRVALRTGSLYWHLTRLIDEGLIAEAPPRRQQDDSRRGTHYRLTAAGRRALDREFQYIERLLSTHRGLKLAPGKDVR